MRGHLAVRSSGAVLLWVIAAILVVSGIGAAIALLSPSSMQSKLGQEAGERAYYNAMSGLNFIISSEGVSESGNINYTNFFNAMGNGSMVTYSLPQGGSFAYQLTTVNASGVNGNYIISNLIGYADPVGGASPYAYALYGGSRGTSGNRPYSPSGGGGGGGGNPAAMGSYGGDLTTANEQQVTGDVVGDKVVLSNETKVDGNVFAATSAKLVNGSEITGNLCSGGDVDMGNSTKVMGDVVSGGDVVIGANSAYVGGNVYAAGKVELKNGAVVVGTINSGSTVDLGSNGATAGCVKSKGDLSLNNAAVVEHDAYSGADIDVKWGGTIKGNAYAIGDITVNAGNGKILGSINKYAPASQVLAPDPAPDICDVPDAPTLSTFTASGSSRTIAYGATASLSPGDFGVVKGNGSNVIHLSSSSKFVKKNPNTTVYVMKSLDLAWDTVLNLDLSSGYIIILVEGDVNLGGKLKIKVNGKAMESLTIDEKKLASKVYLESEGKVDLKTDSQWFGTIVSKGKLTIGNACNIIGAVYSVDNEVKSTNAGSIYYVASDYMNSPSRW